MKKVISLFVITALVLPLLCVPISATEVDAVEYIDYVCLLEVNDNWTSTPRYLDWTTFTGTWAFISLEVE